MTLTEFKRMAEEKIIAMELLWRYGATEFAPWLSGVRRIVAVRSYGFDLEILSTEGLSDTSQKMSRLGVERAAQFQLDGDILSVYKSGCRPATEAEQEALDSLAQKVEENPDMSYWAMQHHFWTFTSAKGRPSGRRSCYEYLLRDRRRKIDPDTGRELIFDKNVRGELALQYKVHGLAA